MSYCDRSPSVVCRTSTSTLSLNNISSETTGWKLMKLGWDIPWMVPYQNCSKNFIPWRTLVAMATKVKNFKNLLLKNHWSNFKIISQKWSLGGPLPKLFKEFWYVKKHGRQGRGQFSLYGYIENFENLLLQNYWSNFKIISQKLSLGGPLPKLFKKWWYVKKHCRLGQAIFP